MGKCGAGHCNPVYGGQSTSYNCTCPAG
jgi:hypothetical protein